MKEILVEHLTDRRKEELGVPPEPSDEGAWAIWECGPSAFDWKYDQTEIAYLYEGNVKVLTKDGEVEIRGGDYVTFPKGLKCRWEVFEKVKKVYKFI